MRQQVTEILKRRNEIVLRMALLIKREVARRISKLSPEQVAAEQIGLFYYCQGKLKEEGRPATPSLMMKAIKGHLLYYPLTRRVAELEREKEKDDPQDYLGPFYDMSQGEIFQYLAWKVDHKGGTLDDFKRTVTKVKGTIKIKTEQGKKDEGNQGGGPSDSGSSSGGDRRSGQGGGEGIPKQVEVRAYGPQRNRKKT